MKMEYEIKDIRQKENTFVVEVVFEGKSYELEFMNDAWEDEKWLRTVENYIKKLAAAKKIKISKKNYLGKRKIETTEPFSVKEV